MVTDEERPRRRRNLKREMNEFRAARALDEAGSALCKKLEKMCDHVDWDWDGTGLQPSLKMMVRFFIATTANDPKRVQAAHELAEEWLATARERYRRGLVGSPFGEERQRTDAPAIIPKEDMTIEESAARDEALQLLEQCNHDESKPYRRCLPRLRRLHDRAPREAFGTNAALVLLELRFLYRAQLPFGIGLDDPPINPFSGKLACQPLMGWDRERGARLTWDGMTTDY